MSAGANQRATNPDRNCPDCEGSGAFDLLLDWPCERCGGTGRSTTSADPCSMVIGL